MSIKNKYKIKSIDNYECKEWLIYKHYAKRIPSISYAFGLHDLNNIIIGVVTYGRPVSHPLIKNAFNGEYQNNFLELNRLVINDNYEKNLLSFFVSESLKMLPKPNVIVSYADTSQGHHGYIYQATNWIYTGLSEKFKDYTIKGFEHLHSASIMDMVGRSDGENGHIDKVALLKKRFGVENVYMIDRPQKHRYFYFLGNKNEIKKMKNLLKYQQMPYPKGDNLRYDSSYLTTIQTKLF
jgi:hypothetical protein